MTVQGHCEPRFEPVRREFERNFAERGEVGASVCVVVDGEPQVDLWGGLSDPKAGRAWEQDTINVVMSCSKGLTAICGHMLIDRGELALDRPIARYWPEFARSGKAEIPVRQAFNHQSGVVHFSDPLPYGGLNDWELLVRLVEDTTPWWEPGARAGYHGVTIGVLIGELVRRVTGRSVGRFFREEVAGPLGLDAWMGLPEEHEPRVAPQIGVDILSVTGFPPRYHAALRDPQSLSSRIANNLGGWLETWDTRESHAAEGPAWGAITNARGLAGAYAPLSLGGTHKGVQLVSENAIARMRYPQSIVDLDAQLLVRTSYTLGFSKSWPNPDLGEGNSVIIGEDAFGTPGMGGQMGFADPSYRLAFGYTMNKHGLGTGLNARGQSLVDATYRCLGSATDKPGFWVRPG
jgi:CubicO group peptidase (beta-lactamase class C family)